MSGAALAMMGSMKLPLAAPIALGSATASISASTNLVITTTSAVPVGGYISVWANGVTVGGFSGGPASVTDQVGNTYVATSSSTGFLPNQLYNFVCEGASAALPSGDTITIAYSAGGPGAVPATAAASYIPGASGVDLTSTGATGNNTTPSISTGALGFAVEIVEVATEVQSGASDTWTEGAGFTTLQTVTNTAALHIAYIKTTTTSSQTYSPTNSATRNWSTSFVTFN